MAKEALAEILQSEEKASQIIKDAKEASKTYLKEEEDQLAKELEAKVARVQEEIRQAEEKIRQQAQAQAQSKLDQAKQKAEQIGHTSRETMEVLADKLVDEVLQHGDR